MADDVAKAPVWRNPWVWVFVVGAVVLTSTRSCFRHVPDAPPVVATLPALAGVGIDGGSADGWTAPGDVFVLGLFCADGTAACDASASAMRKLAMVYASTGEPAPGLVLVWPGASAEDAKAARRARRAHGTERAGMRYLLVPDGDALVATLERARGAAAGEDAALWTTLVLVDGAGGVRGFYGHERYEIASELYHRVSHVRSAAGATGDRGDGGG